MEVKNPNEQAKESIKPLFCAAPRENFGMVSPSFHPYPATKYCQEVEELINKLAIKDGLSHNTAAEKLIKEGAKAFCL